MSRSDLGCGLLLLQHLWIWCLGCCRVQVLPALPALPDPVLLRAPRHVAGAQG